MSGGSLPAAEAQGLPRPSRVVLIDRADGGLGRAIATRLVQAGWPVYAGARNPAPLEALRELGCYTPRLDLDDPSARRALVAHIEGQHGAVGVLVELEPLPEDREPPHGARPACILPDGSRCSALAEALLPAMQAQAWGRLVRIVGSPDRSARRRMPRPEARSGNASGIASIRIEGRMDGQAASADAAARLCLRAIEARQPRRRYRVPRVTLRGLGRRG